MKKRVVFAIAFLVLMLFIGIIAYTNYVKEKKEVLTGKTVTGEATTGTTAITVSVLAGLPTLNLVSPENKTYITTKNLFLNFTAIGTNVIWYNLDSGSNITITNNATFNTTTGQHTLYLYANNTDGNITSENITFTVDTTFIVYYSNFKDNGSSTDFNSTAYEDLQNLSNIVLENTNYGKIAFNQEINVTNSIDFSNHKTDLNNNTNISSNFIDINSTALPNFNKSATLYLYNLSFSNPRILRNGAVCPDTICAKQSYSQDTGILIFNVTQFSNYSAEETPVTTPAPSGGGGGSGTTSFSLSKDELHISLVPGQTERETITIKNTGTQSISLTIQNMFNDFITTNESIVNIKTGESETIGLYIFTKEDTIPGIYLGKIIIGNKEVLVSVEVESAGVLLDVRAEILNGYKRILPGGYILSQIRLFNLGGGSNGKQDVIIEYIVSDYDKNEIVRETESLAIETQTNFIKEIDLPENIQTGKYILYIRAITIDNKIASASDNFEIVSSLITNREKVYIAIIVLLSIIISLIVYYKLKDKKRGGKKLRVTEGKVSLGKIIRK